MATLNDLNPYQRHKRLLKELESYYGESLQRFEPAVAVSKTDADTLRETYRFIRTEKDDEEGNPWELRLARTYYAKLFREYAIVDLSRYKTGELGCRWRTKQEVVSGKGQFICGSQDCQQESGLESYEVPFAYQESGAEKQALVKVRLCQKHALRLNYKRTKAMLKAQQRKTDASVRSSNKRKRHAGQEASDGAGEVKQNAQQESAETPDDKAAQEARLNAEVNDFLSQLLV